MEIQMIDFVGLAVLGQMIHILAKLKGFALGQIGDEFLISKWLHKNLILTAISVLLVSVSAYAYTFTGFEMNGLSALVLGYTGDSLVKILGKGY